MKEKFSSVPKKPLSLQGLSVTELNRMLEEGYADVLAGRTVNAKDAFEELMKPLKPQDE